MIKIFTIHLFLLSFVSLQANESNDAPHILEVDLSKLDPISREVQKLIKKKKIADVTCFAKVNDHSFRSQWNARPKIYTKRHHANIFDDKADYLSCCHDVARTRKLKLDDPIEAYIPELKGLRVLHRGKRVPPTKGYGTRCDDPLLGLPMVFPTHA